MELQFPDLDAAAVPVAGASVEPPAAVSARTQLARISIQDVALAKFGDWRPSAAALVAKFKDVAFDAATPKGYKALAEAIAEVRAPRYAAQNVDKAFASEVTQLRKAVGAEKDEIVAYLAPVEAHLVAQKDAHDAKVKAEAEARAAAEQARKDVHEANLRAFRAAVGNAKGKTSGQLADALSKLEAFVVDPAAWEEYADTALQAKADVMAALSALYVSTKAEEDERARMEALRIENARLAAELAEQQRLAAIKAAELAEETAKLVAARAEFARQQEAARAATLPPALPALEVAEQAIAEQQPAPKIEPVRPVVRAAAPSAVEKLFTTGVISDWLGFTLTADYIRGLGFAPVPQPKAGTFWRASDLPLLRDALVARLNTLKAPQ